jgi:hypothetical protein
MFYVYENNFSSIFSTTFAFKKIRTLIRGGDFVKVRQKNKLF